MILRNSSFENIQMFVVLKLRMKQLLHDFLNTNTDTKFISGLRVMEGQPSIEPGVDKDKATEISKKCWSFPQVPFLFILHFDFMNFLGDFCFETKDYCDFTNFYSSFF